MGKLNLSRSEVIFCGIMLLGAAGFGIHRLGHAIYKMQEPQIFEDATRIIPLGETLSLTVVEVAVKNIDAEEGDFTWRYANVTGISGSDGAITLQQLFDLYSDTPIDDNGQYLASSLWCVDGESSSEYSAEAVLPQGETALITLGFTLENGAEEHLDEMSLIYRSIFDRLAIGSPTLGGETDEAV